MLRIIAMLCVPLCHHAAGAGCCMMLHSCCYCCCCCYRHIHTCERTSLTVTATFWLKLVPFAPCPPALRGVWSGWVSSAHCAWAGPAEPRSLLSLGRGGWPPPRLSFATMGVSRNVAPPGPVGAPSGLALYYCSAWVASESESLLSLV